MIESSGAINFSETMQKINQVGSIQGDVGNNQEVTLRNHPATQLVCKFLRDLALFMYNDVFGGEDGDGCDYIIIKESASRDNTILFIAVNYDWDGVLHTAEFYLKLDNISRVIEEDDTMTIKEIAEMLDTVGISELKLNEKIKITGQLIGVTKAIGSWGPPCQKVVVQCDINSLQLYILEKDNTTGEYNAWFNGIGTKFYRPGEDWEKLKGIGVWTERLSAESHPIVVRENYLDDYDD